MYFESLEDVKDILYDLVEDIEKHKEFLFVINNNPTEGLFLIDVLDYETEDAIDGGWYTSREAIQFMQQYKAKYEHID